VAEADDQDAPKSAPAKAGDSPANTPSQEALGSASASAIAPGLAPEPKSEPKPAALESDASPSDASPSDASAQPDSSDQPERDQAFEHDLVERIRAYQPFGLEPAGWPQGKTRSVPTRMEISERLERVEYSKRELAEWRAAMDRASAPEDKAAMARSVTKAIDGIPAAIDRAVLAINQRQAAEQAQPVRVWKPSEQVEWLFEKIDQHPPPADWGQVMAWCRSRLEEMEVDFAKANRWKNPDTIRKKLSDIQGGRLRRPEKK
jgi:hypothetical protein